MRSRHPRLAGLRLVVGGAVACATNHPVRPPSTPAPGAGEPARTLGEREVQPYFAPFLTACSDGDAGACRRLAQRCHSVTNDREATNLTRVGTTGTSLDALAFKSPEGSIVTVMYNAGTTAKTAILSVGGTKYQFSIPGTGWATVLR